MFRFSTIFLDFVDRLVLKRVFVPCSQPADVCEQILRVVSRSSRLEELVLDNVGLRRSEVNPQTHNISPLCLRHKRGLCFCVCSDFAQKLAVALSQNPASSLLSLNLSNNSLEDKGLNTLGLHQSIRTYSV